jgi:hypothetical protein
MERYTNAHILNNMLKYASTVAGTSQQEIAAVVDPNDENRVAEVGQDVTPQGRSIKHPVPCALCKKRGKRCIGLPGKTCIACAVAKKGCEKRMGAQRKQRKPVARRIEPALLSRKPRLAHTVPHPAMPAVCVEITSKPWFPTGGKRKSEMRARSGIGGLPEDDESPRRVLDHTPLRKGKGKAADSDVTPIQTSPKTLDKLAVAVTRRTELLAEVRRVEAQITVLADILARERK